MIKISYSRKFEKQLEQIPEYMRTRVFAWIEAVKRIGLSEVQKTPGYHDEPLRGSRSGQRSVRLNRSYRLIYWVIEKAGSFGAAGGA